MLLLFAILTTVTGAALGLLANARRIGELIAGGALDAALALPTNPLAYLLTRRVDTALLGDLAFGPVLFVVAGDPTPERAVVFVFGAVCGTVVLVGFLVALGSVTLFAGGRGEQADLGFQAILIFASYPIDVFGGLTKLFLFTAVPAAFVTGLPTSLVSSFTLGGRARRRRRRRVLRPRGGDDVPARPAPLQLRGALDEGVGTRAPPAGDCPQNSSTPGLSQASPSSSGSVGCRRDQCHQLISAPSTMMLAIRYSHTSSSTRPPNARSVSSWSEKRR